MLEDSVLAQSFSLAVSVEREGMKIHATAKMQGLLIC